MNVRQWVAAHTIARYEVDGAKVIPERLASNLGDRAGGQGDLRGLLIADMWIPGGHQHQTITKMLSDALLLGPIPMAQR